MKKNIRILIIAAILGLIALSAIQAYLINNTYKLEKDVFIDETKRAVFRFDNDLKTVDSIYDVIGDHVVLKISDYKLQRIKKTQILDSIKFVTDSINAFFISEYEKEFKKRNVLYPIKYQKRLHSIIILDSLKNDTLYFEANVLKKQHLLGEYFEPNKEYGINNSQVETSFTRKYVENGGPKSLTFYFQFTTQDYINIDGWKHIVLRRMTSILILSILIFALVLGLLYYAIKNLITQKKITDVKTDFINNITHELKTPLATLSLATKMLKNDAVKSKPEIITSTINTIDRQSGRLQKLIDQVLNNSLGYNEITLQKETVKVAPYIHTILDDFLLSVKNKQVIVHRDIATTAESISIDKFFLTTAILNILENAVKYNGDAIEIHCKTNLKEEFILEITDNGIGIPEKHHSQLFDKFYRAGNTEVHDVKGLGLGLYYTNQIVKAHQGSITIKSREGQGTTFTISIPIN